MGVCSIGLIIPPDAPSPKLGDLFPSFSLLKYRYRGCNCLNFKSSFLQNTFRSVRQEKYSATRNKADTACPIPNQARFQITPRIEIWKKWTHYSWYCIKLQNVSRNYITLVSKLSYVEGSGHGIFCRRIPFERRPGGAKKWWKTARGGPGDVPAQRKLLRLSLKSKSM